MPGKALVLTALCCSLLAAAGGKDRKTALAPGEAENYAEQLNYALTLIGDQYVRPIARADLIAAALTGLYETARVPAPPSLQTTVKKTVAQQELYGLIDLAPGGLKVGELYGWSAPNEPVALIARVRKDLGDHEGIRGDNALRASLQSVTRVLDPHSALIRGDELQRDSRSEFQQGFGLDLAEGIDAGALVVKTVPPGGPAQQAGIRPGDRITRVNGKPVSEANRLQVLGRLRAQTVGEVIEQADLVRLTVGRAGAGHAREVKLAAQSFHPESVLGVARLADNGWEYFVDARNKIAHVRIAALAYGTAEELRDILTGLHAKGLRGLILDLRWCPGGLLEEAAGVADLFLSNSRIATIRTRDQQTKEFLSHGDGNFLGFPVLVLVNGETSGGAELIAAALQDNGRAVVGGQRSIGKASIQTMVALPIRNTGMKLTTGVFIRPGGKNMHRFADSKPSDDWGVRPDPKLEFRVSAELGRQLREWWLLQSLRPGECNEALPLDDPDQDPQRQLALKALREMINRNAEDNPRIELGRAP